MGNFSKYYARLVQEYPDNNARGKVFEHHCTSWLKADPIWSRQIQDVVPFKDWRPEWSVDIGTDLVMTLKNGEIWSVQCKALKPGENVNLNDSRLGNFLSHSMGPEFDRRLLMSTRSSLGKNVQKMIDFQARDLTAIFDADFENSPVDIYELAFGNRVKLQNDQRKALRDYQNRAVDAVIAEFELSDVTQISMACGTGKTFTGYSIWKEMGPQTTLVLVPSIHLLKQTLNEWISFERFDPSFEWIAVCSDETVDNDPDLPGNKLQNFSSPTTTSVAAIQEFLRTPNPKVIFSTYQSSNRVKEAFTRMGEALSLVLCDEAHKLVGPVKDLSPYLSMVHPRPAFINKTLFMTATPKVINPSVLTRLENLGGKALSMNNEKTFGRRSFTFSFGEAIPQYLSPYRIAITLITDSEIRDSIERRKIVEVGQNPKNIDSVAKHVALQKAIKKYGLTRIISYHSSLKLAEEFSRDSNSGRYLSEAGIASPISVESRFVSGKQNSDARSKNLQILKDGTKSSPKLVTNARCLTEGIDIPALDAVMFADPKYSEVDIVQAVGRSLRSFPGKSIGTVVVPIFADSNEDFEEQISKSRWNTVWRTIRAMESHDPTLNSELSKLRTELGKASKPKSLPGEIEILGLEKLPPGFAESLSLRIIRESTNSWYERFGEYQAMTVKLKTGRVPQNLGRGAKKVPEGVWGAHQRTLYKQNKLDEEQVSLLESIPGWSWVPLDDDWEYAIGRCREAGKKFKNYLKIPGNYVDETGFRVGQWLTSITSNARWKSVSRERKNQLRDAMPGFVQSKRERSWMLGLEVTSDWLQGDMSNPDTITIPESGTKLSSWLQVNTGLWQKRDNPNLENYESERISLLAKVPGWAEFAVSRRSEESLKAIGKLKKFPDEGGCLSYYLFRCNGKCQKHFDKASKCIRTEFVLDKSQLDFKSPAVMRLRRYLEGLEAYSAVFGTTYHPQTKSGATFVWETLPLGSTLNSIRSQKHESDEAKRISEVVDQVQDPARPIARLQNRTSSRSTKVYQFFSCPGNCEKHFGTKGGACASQSLEVDTAKLNLTSASLQALLGYLEALEDYSQATGRSTHPQNKGRKPFKWNGYPLGSALNRYRTRLSPEMKAEIGPILEQIPEWAWTAKGEDDWIEKFTILQKYSSTFHTARVPQGTVYDGYNLGNWVHRQLNAGRGKRYGPLEEWQKNALNSLPNWTFDTWDDRTAYANRQEVWDKSFKAYLKYLRSDDASCLPRQDLQIDGIFVGRWVETQISKILGRATAGAISESEVNKLLEIECVAQEIQRRRNEK